jgi:hypothetical protein
MSASTPISLDDARQALVAARDQNVRACQAELAELLKKYNCTLASHQEWVNGMPQGPARIILLPAD